MSEMCEATSPFFLSHSGAQHVLTAALTLFGSTCFFIVVCVVRSSKHNRTLPGSKKKEKTKSGESTAKSDKNGNVQLKFFRKLARSSPPSRHPRDLHAEENNREAYEERLRLAAAAKQTPLCNGTPQHDMRIPAKVEAQKPMCHMFVPSSVHVDQKTSNLSVDNTLFIGKTVTSRTRSPDQRNKVDLATAEENGNMKLIEGETMVPLKIPPNANHGLLPPLTAEELAAFHRERRELISRFEAKRLELREDRRRRGLPSKRSTTTSSASDPLSTSPCSNDDVFPPPLSLKEQHPVENTAASSTTPMPMTPSVTIVSSLNSTLAGISSSPLVNEELLSAVPSTAHSLSPKNHTSSSSSSSGTLSGKSTALTPQLNTVQGVGGSKASPDGGNEDGDDGGMSRPPVTISAQLPAPVVIELGLSDDEHERLKPFLHKWRREDSDDYFAFHFDELKQTVTYTLCVKKNSNKSSIVMKKSDIPLGRETVFTDYPTIGLIQWIKIDLDERDLVIVGRANKPREKTTLDRLVLLDNGARLKNIEYDNGKETSRIHYFIREK